ncbi:MAG: hypothetical protein ACLUEQ_11480 [Cloacibacillus evryensis]
MRYKETKATNFSQDPRVFTAVRDRRTRRAEGGAAVSDYNVNSAGRRLPLPWPQSELDRACDITGTRAAIERAAASIRKFAELQRIPSGRS